MGAFSPWKIVHLNVSHPVSSLCISCEQGYGGVLVFFWWKTIPLGQKQIPIDSLPETQAELLRLIFEAITPALQVWGEIKNKRPETDYILKNRTLDLSALLDEEEHLLTSKKQFSVSVVICTRDRAADLQKCLASLKMLKTRPKEILVVDNASRTNETLEVTKKFSDVKYIYEARPGLSIARNTGVQQCTGDIVLFTDDDVEVHPHWLNSLLANFTDPEVMVVTGPVIPTTLSTEAEWIFENHWGLNKGFTPRTFDEHFLKIRSVKSAPIWDVGAGANMAVRRDAFQLAGHFDEALGAGASGCSEDSEFWYRILVKGYIIKYDPRAVVFHTHRGDLIKLKRQIYFYMRGHAVSLLIQHRKYRMNTNLFRLCYCLPSWYIKRLLSAEPLRTPNSTLFLEVKGWMSGIYYFLTHCHTANSQAVNHSLSKSK
jgi:GT2 family glycosyltransferase